ncbi:MAG: hypothetical protein ORO03_06830 [Alphaproteobacteria bacterium]|nr:hypothetical protein [Alphaproteobacteria bacterium]
MGKSSTPAQAAQPTTVVNNSSPWAGQQSYLSFGFKQAQDAYNQSLKLAAQPVAPSAATVAAQQQIMGTAAANQPLLAAGRNQLQATLGGDYLAAGNPYLQAMMQQTVTAMRPSIDSQFVGAGRYGSGAYANALDSSLSNAAANLAFQQYNQERGNQLSALNNLSQVAGEQYSGANALAAVGASQDAGRANQTNAAFDAIGKYMNLINGNYGSSSTQQTSYYTPPAVKTGLLDSLAKLF